MVLSDPLALIPFACAARDGRVGDVTARELVAAGTTLLVRSALLVRALAGRRGAILLPNGPAFLTALAACDGRGAVLLDPRSAPATIARQLADANAGAVFTSEAMAARLPEHVPRVLLDGAPREARVVAGGDARTVDLGSHVGLELEGDPEATGREEEAVIVYGSPGPAKSRVVLSHRTLLHDARAAGSEMALSANDRVLAATPFSHPFGLTVSLLAPLLAGATVHPAERLDPARLTRQREPDAITVAVATPAHYEALLAGMDGNASSAAHTLRLCIGGGASLDPGLQQRWEARMHVPLRDLAALASDGGTTPLRHDP